MIDYILDRIGSRHWNKAKAFTLTEVLLAIMIVGIIAALVLPATVTYYQDKIFEKQEMRQKEALNNALGLLVINENKVKFSETIMNADTPGTTDDTVGKFIKRYLRVAKYCGAPTGGKSECFADNYSEYVGGDKKTVNIVNLGLDGACAQLKNGVSLCLTRQVGGNPVKVVMDLNGPKGPNIIGRDFIRSQQLQFQASKDIDRVADKNGVDALDRPPLDETDYNPCSSINDKSTACCTWRKTNGEITGPTHKCCENPSIKANTDACVTKVVVRANYNTEKSGEFYARPYISAIGTEVQTPKDYVLPSDPSLSLKINCSGVYQGTPTMSNSTLRSLINSSSGKQYFTKRLRYTHTTIGKSCHYNQHPVYWSNGSKDITIDNVQYHLDQY